MIMFVSGAGPLVPVLGFLGMLLVGLLINVVGLSVSFSVACAGIIVALACRWISQTLASTRIVRPSVSNRGMGHL